MAYFEDLTPYTYCFSEQDPPGTVNIGWLEPAYPFLTGTTSEEFQTKLKRLCHRRVRQTRGFHSCGFRGGLAPGSSFEMRVTGSDMVYAAPSLVHHDVVAHGYKPPDRFIAAMLAWDETAPRLGQEELWARLSNLGCREISSLNSRSSYRIVSIDQTAKRYEVEYTSGKRFVFSLDELYAIYRELYGRGSFTHSFMKDNARRVLGWSVWNRRGSSMFAILPLIDDCVRDVRGLLCLWRPLVGESDTEGPA